MTRKFGTRLPKSLYPSGWPSNLRASVYLNNKRRDKFLQTHVADAAWVSTGAWYQVGDTVTYSAVVYRCVQNHESGPGHEPDTDTDRWVEDT